LSIIGCAGSGKSTLAVRLGDLLDLPVIHLDQHFWQAGWQVTPREVWRERVQSLVERERWIIDGHYRSTMDIRLPCSDTIVFLDYATWRCLLGVARRVWRYRGRTRPDLAPDCPERMPDWQFLNWILGFRTRHRPEILERLEGLEPGTRRVMCKTPGELEAYVRSLRGYQTRTTKG
jgi:adenylate kinase family enzyme